MSKNAIDITNGCPENRIDCAEIELFLKQNGWEIAPTPDQANVIILNLCGLINETEEKSLDLIKMVNGKKKPNTRVLVTGCLPKINNASIKNIFQGEIIKGHNIKGISEALGVEGNYNGNSPHYLVPSRDPKSTKYKFRKIVQNGLDPYFFLNRLHKPKYRK